MNYAIILAAGQGQRMKAKEDKLFMFAAGHPVLYYTIAAFNDHPEIEEIYIAANKINEKQIKKLIKDFHFSKVKSVVIGGLTRQGSMEKAFKEIGRLAKPTPGDLVLVHNGDNPLVDIDEINSAIDSAAVTGACIVGHPVKSTVKELEGSVISKTHDRSRLFAAETPQVARYEYFDKAIKKARSEKFEVTDEAMLLENAGYEVSVVPASENNFKITTQGDIQKLRAVLGELPEDFRVGIGQDSHEFDKEKMGLAIGGIHLPDQPKLKANSDGDVILHAIFNALSQALGDKSLGFYADPMCEKGVKDSRKYLEPLLKKLKKSEFEIKNLGIMVECKTPKIDPLSAELKKSLAEILDVNVRRIGITATSGENLTAFGAGLGIQCFAIVSLTKV